MKIKLNAPKPRNPFATAARQRVAGAHRPSAGAQRSQARHALQHELATLRNAGPDHRQTPSLERHRPSP